MLKMIKFRMKNKNQWNMLGKVQPMFNQTMNSIKNNIKKKSMH